METIFSDPFIIIMTVLLLALFIIRIADIYDKRHEGFAQSKPYIVRQGNQIYDGFYADIYDELNNTAERSGFEYNKLIELTRPSINNSVFLDIGSGTGHLVHILTTAGYNAMGIDSSKDMTDHTHKHFPESEVKCGDASDPMTFDKGIFTHITCMNYTIYNFDDKRTFFRNCRDWLQPNGFLVVHLVDKDKYNPHATEETTTFKNARSYGNERKLKATIGFRDFDYTSTHTFESGTTVRVKETFTDHETNNVRENDFMLYMENKEDIIRTALATGFVAHAQVNTMTDEHQFIYVFERLM